jgi:aspergillopepsin I
MVKMGTYSSLASSLLFITTALASQATNSGTFKVLQQPNLNFTKNAAAIHFSDLAKYNVTHNSTYAAAIAAKKQSGSTPAIPLIWESEYVSPVVIGGQTVYLDFDTGSSDLQVPSLHRGRNQ